MLLDTERINKQLSLVINRHHGAYQKKEDSGKERNDKSSAYASITILQYNTYPSIDTLPQLVVHVLIHQESEWSDLSFGRSSAATDEKRETYNNN